MLHLFHQSDRAGRLAQMEVLSFEETEPMFGADAPAFSRDPLVEIWFDNRCHMFRIFRCSRVEMQVS